MNSNFGTRQHSKSSQAPSTTKYDSEKRKKKHVNLTVIKQLERMDRKIDRRRWKEDLIGKIKERDKHTATAQTIPKHIQQELAYLKIRNFHKLNL